MREFINLCTDAKVPVAAYLTASSVRPGDSPFCERGYESFINPMSKPPGDPEKVLRACTQKCLNPDVSDAEIMRWGHSYFYEVMSLLAINTWDLRTVAHFVQELMVNRLKFDDFIFAYHPSTVSYLDLQNSLPNLAEQRMSVSGTPLSNFRTSVAGTPYLKIFILQRSQPHITLGQILVSIKRQRICLSLGKNILDVALCRAGKPPTSVSVQEDYVKTVVLPQFSEDHTEAWDERRALFYAAQEMGS